MSDVTGSVAVEVVPDARGWSNRLKAQILPDAERVGADFGKALGSTAAQKINKGVSDGLKDGARGAGTQGAKAGSEFSGKFAESLKARLEAALKNLPDIKLRADSTDADRAIVGIRRNLEILRDKKIGVDITAGEAEASLADLKIKLDDLGAKSPDVRVRLDAAAASAQLAAFQAEVDKVGSERVTVEVNADTGEAEAELAALDASAVGASGGFGGLLTSILALGPALIPIAAAGAAAMAAIGAGAVAATAGVGVLVFALAPVIAAVRALGAAHAASGRAAASSANAQLQAAAAADSVKTAQRGLAQALAQSKDAQVKSAEAIKNAQRSLADAEHDAAQDQIESAERVADAKRRLADVSRQAALDAKTAARNLAEAERSVADAQKSALQAQQDLNDARRQAVEDAQDLANQVIDGQLDQRDATLQLQQAQDDLNSTLADPTATDRQRQQAQLTFDQAQQRLAEQIEQNARLAAQQAASDQAGVDGSTVVQNAQDALAQAQRDLTAATQAQTDAAAAEAEQQRKSAEDITAAQRDISDAVREASNKQRKDLEAVAEAQQRVADSVRDAASQQRQSSASIASAQQAVVTAQRGVEQASNRAGLAGGAAADTVAQKMAKLTPAGREFVTFVSSELLPAFSGLSGVAQAGLLPGLESGLKSLLPLLSPLKGFVGDVAAEMGNLFAAAGKALTAPFWRGFFGFLSGEVLSILRVMGPVLGNFAEGFAGLFVAFGPVIDSFGTGLLAVSRDFSSFGAEAEKNKGFQAFLEYVSREGPIVERVIGQVVQAVGHVVGALAPVGAVSLVAIGGLAKFVSSLNPVLIRDVSVAIIGIAVALKAVNLALLVLDANPVVLIVAAVVGVGIALVELYRGSQTFRDIVNKVWADTSAAVSAAWAFIQPILVTFGSFMAGVLGPAVRAFYEGAVRPAFRGIADAISVAWKVAEPIFKAIDLYVRYVLAPVFQAVLLPQVKVAWSLIQIAIQVAWVSIQIVFKSLEIAVKILGGIFTDLWKVAVKPALDGIGTVISVAWNTVIKPVLVAFGGFIVDHVAPAFRKGVDLIGTIWGKVLDIAKKPVKFIALTVINDGIIGPFNKVAKVFGISAVDPIVLPKGFATGGVVPGFAPGVDSVPAMLSPGEGILRPEVVRRLGPETIHAWNRAAISGGNAFSGGGIVGKIAGGAGALLGDIASSVGDLLKDPAGVIKRAVKGALAKVTEQFGDNPFVKVAEAAPLKLAEGLGSKLAGLIGFGGGGGGGGSVVGPPGNPTGNQAIVKSLAESMYGWTGEEWTDLYKVIMHESGFNNTAQNPTSSAYGMFQFLDGTWSGVGGSKTSNPVLQTQYGLKYIKSAYGDPIGAWGHEVATGWYDNGGYLPPGLSTVFNGTSKPEPVFTAGQWDILRAGAHRDTAAPNVNVTVNNPIPETAAQSTTHIMRRLAALKR